MEQQSGRLIVVGGEEGKSVCSRLGKLGFPADAAQGEDQALQMIEEGGHDLLLVDVRCARDGDYRILKSVRSSPKGGSIPIIVYTEQADVDPDDTSIEMGADDYLVGFSNSSRVRSQLRRSLDAKQLRDMLAACTVELDSLRKLSHDFTKVIVPIGIALSG